MCSVAFFIVEVEGGIIKCFLRFLKYILIFFNWKWSKTSIREILYDKTLSKTFPSSKISSSSSSSPPKYWSKNEDIVNANHHSRLVQCAMWCVMYSSICQFVWQHSRLRHCHWVWIYSCYNWWSWACMYLPYWPRLIVVVNS